MDNKSLCIIIIVVVVVDVVVCRSSCNSLLVWNIIVFVVAKFDIFLPVFGVEFGVINNINTLDF